MGIDEQLLIIRRNDFLALLTKEDYESLNLVHNFIIADKNAYIYFDAQDINKLYFVKDGHVKIGNVDDEGNEIVREILLPGDVFGQFTLQRNNLQGEFAQAYKEEVAICAFTIDDFTRLLTNRPELAVHFTKKIGERVKRVDYRLINLLQKDARTRVLYFFWSLSQQQEDTRQNTFTIDNYFTHEDIARLTGTSRQTVTTLISQFTTDGLIEVDRKEIRLKDIKLLQKEAKVG
jgi:CRP/FNR family transcriptional regulator, cyclic AMP receptor protein